MGRRLRHLIAVTTTNDWERIMFKLLEEVSIEVVEAECPEDCALRNDLNGEVNYSTYDFRISTGVVMMAALKVNGTLRS